MKKTLLTAILLSSAAHAGTFSTSDVRPYPAGWPALSGMSPTCAEVQGSYIDPNLEHWAYGAHGEPYRGSYERAWEALGLPADEAQSDKKTAMPRVFSIEVNANQTVTIKYMVDGELASMRSFGKNEWSCGPAGLALTLVDHTGSVFKRGGAEGRTITRATIYRVRRHIYVRSTDSTKAWAMKVVPQSVYEEHWSRFEVSD